MKAKTARSTRKQQLNLKRLQRSIEALIKQPQFNKWFAWSAVSILAATTLFWSILGSNVNKSNADQLVNPMLFQNSAIAHGAQIPGQHTFLLKWPIFWFISVAHFSSGAYVFWTVFACLITVAALAWLIYRIERRPLVFGCLCLALASVLLLVPTQPYPGGLLPVNMAMLATRNIEYVFYLAGLALMIKAGRLRSWGFWIGALLLALLIASDKLFLSLGLGGAALALVVYALRSSWELVGLAVRWLIGIAIGIIGATAILWLVGKDHFLHIVNQSALAPYGLIHSLHDLVLGLFYGVFGLLTNFGANPAYSATIVRNIPSELWHKTLSFGGPEAIVNLLVLAVGLYAAWKIIWPGIIHKQKRLPPTAESHKLALALIWTSLAAFGVFVLSNHYWAVDQRYLTIWLFAIFVSLACFTRQRQWHKRHLLVASGVIVITMLFGLVATWHNNQSEVNALADTNDRNQQVVQILQSHSDEVLIGDYWRVVPIKYLAGSNLDIVPLSSCSQTRQILSSTAWQVDLAHHKFAYLLSLDRSLTGFSACTLDQVVSTYGRPNSSVLISGTYASPKEELLFYDHGSNMSAPAAAPKSLSTVVPITADALPYTSCPVPTLMTIVAHQDDDLLFTSPDLLNDIKAGHCIRTVYVTAGDAGTGDFYWLSREQGSEAAYSEMLGGTDQVWVKRILELSSHEFVTVANPRGNSNVSLIFMQLPDGNLKGEGFRADSYQSLTKLDSGSIKSVTSVDKQSTYSQTDLVGALTELMHIYQPEEIHTQSNFVSKAFPDHSDHMAVGRFVQKSYKQYESEQFEDQVTIPIKYYLGYSARGFPENISGTSLTQKEAAWFAYGVFDGGVCHSVADCNHTPTYGSYLKRQYTAAY